MSSEKGETYLGDGLYISMAGTMVRLRAPRDNEDHVVYLETDVLNAFLSWIKEMRGEEE